MKIAQYPELIVLRATRRDYDSHGSELQADPLTNFEEWHGWFQRFQLLGIKGRVCSDNRQVFRRLWGKPSFCWSGSHYCHCWLLDLKEARLLVLTARKMGTAYELVVKHKGVTQDPKILKVFDFMEYLAETLPKLRENSQQDVKPAKRE